MRDDAESTCRACPMHATCEGTDGQERTGLSGWRLAGVTAGCFLLPPAAGLAAAAVGAARGELASVLAGIAAFAAAMLLAGAVARRIRGSGSP